MDFSLVKLRYFSISEGFLSTFLTSLCNFQVKGLKKVENFLKKEEDIANWKKYATPEDAEYYECQLELQQDLLKSYNSVERIIGTFHLYLVFTLLFAGFRHANL